jgi:hypothetical protein
MRLDEERICDNGAKSTQRCDESELTELLAKIEIELHAAEMFLPMKTGEIAFNRQFHDADYDQYRQCDQPAGHSSFP